MIILLVSSAGPLVLISTVLMLTVLTALLACYFFL